MPYIRWQSALRDRCDGQPQGSRVHARESEQGNIPLMASADSLKVKAEV